MYFSGLSQGGSMELSQQQAKNNKPWRRGSADYTVKGTAFPTLSHSPSSTCNLHTQTTPVTISLCANGGSELRAGGEKWIEKDLKNIKPVFVLHCCIRENKSYFYFLLYFLQYLQTNLQMVASSCKKFVKLSEISYLSITTCTLPPSHGE